MLLNIMTAEQIFLKMAPLNMYIKYRWVDDVDLKVTHREVLLNNRPKTLGLFHWINYGLVQLVKTFVLHMRNVMHYKVRGWFNSSTLCLLLLIVKSREKV